MDANQEKKEQEKTSKDFIWLLVGAVVLIIGLIMLKTVMQQVGLMG